MVWLCIAPRERRKRFFLVVQAKVTSIAKWPNYRDYSILLFFSMGNHNYKMIILQLYLGDHKWRFHSKFIKLFLWAITDTIAGIPVEGKSSECLICMKYRIIILIIIISLGQICMHACIHARANTRAHARIRTRTREHTCTPPHPSPPSPFAA